MIASRSSNVLSSILAGVLLASFGGAVAASPGRGQSGGIIKPEFEGPRLETVVREKPLFAAPQVVSPAFEPSLRDLSRWRFPEREKPVVQNAQVEDLFRRPGATKPIAYFPRQWLPHLPPYREEGRNLYYYRVGTRFLTGYRGLPYKDVYDHNTRRPQRERERDY